MSVSLSPARLDGGIAHQTADAPAAGLQLAAVADVALREYVHPSAACHQALHQAPMQVV